MRKVLILGCGWLVVGLLALGACSSSDSDDEGSVTGPWTAEVTAWHCCGDTQSACTCYGETEEGGDTCDEYPSCTPTDCCRVYTGERGDWECKCFSQEGCMEADGEEVFEVNQCPP